MLKNRLLLIIFNLIILNIPITSNIENINKDMLIEIPKIKLKKNLYPNNSVLNNIDKNLMVIGNMPNEKGKLIIAGHSGEGEAAYFNDLAYLELEDEIYIYYNEILYTYVIYDIYDIEKTGKLYLNKNENNIVVLVTCKIGYNKQIVYKGALKSN